MPANFVLGYECYLYIGDTAFDQRPAGTGTHDYNSVTWSELDVVQDVTDNFESEKVDTTTRSEAKVGWASEIQTTKSGNLSFTMRWKKSDTKFVQMVDAWLASSEVSLLDLDGKI